MKMATVKSSSQSIFSLMFAVRRKFRRPLLENSVILVLMHLSLYHWHRPVVRKLPNSPPTYQKIYLITVDLRPWGRTDKPWKWHLFLARDQTPLSRKPFTHFGIRDRSRESLCKFNCWSCFTIALASDISFWLLNMLTPSLRRWLPLRELWPLVLSWVSSIITTPISPLCIKSIRIYSLILPLRFLPSPFIRNSILNFSTMTSLGWVMRIFLTPPNIMFNPAQNTTIIFFVIVNSRLQTSYVTTRKNTHIRHTQKQLPVWMLSHIIVVDCHIVNPSLLQNLKKEISKIIKLVI